MTSFAFDMYSCQISLSGHGPYSWLKNIFFIKELRSD